ncbi:DUF3048 domain-containing protein [Actinomadura barringtoniae]|uniref:DUF3048 domain-containing protein n=1 Tax=Actinomadura barringtoniae TaxID=1427535 RepID=A0A939TDX5_9ACTN|nr:DUF3048 domain-containing protein [Actinomadura barringtoniae]MBO2452755.1 DUF3048 domain-containing protein [Actinomadura barringtoniae]
MVRTAWNGTVQGRAAAVLGVVALGGALAACSSSDKHKTATPSSPEAPPASETPAPTTHPFNGGKTGLKNPVLAVKVENTRSSMPQAGVKDADIVYVEQVEGGETRLMAIFSSKLPKRVGAVRSARISDLHILPQFGKPAFAFSGVQPAMKKYIRRAPVFDISQDNGGSAYYRYGEHPIPYNLFANPKDLLKQAPKATGPRDIGFTFGPAPDGGKPIKNFTAKWPATTMGFSWSAKQNRWLTSFNGRPDMAREGGQLGGKTVVVQQVKTTRSQFKDVLGAYTPLIKSVGTGKATVLRDGKAFDAQWSRPSEDKGTTYTTPDGKPLNFPPGQVWVVLVNEGKPYMP